MKAPWRLKVHVVACKASRVTVSGQPDCNATRALNVQRTALVPFEPWQHHPCQEHHGLELSGTLCNSSYTATGI